MCYFSHCLALVLWLICIFLFRFCNKENINELSITDTLFYFQVGRVPGGEPLKSGDIPGWELTFSNDAVFTASHAVNMYSISLSITNLFGEFH